MRWMLAELIVVGLLSQTASEPAGYDPLKALWPSDVAMPKGLKEYKPWRFSQRLVILNGQRHNHWWPNHADHPFANSSPEQNPNARHPWAVPGGMDNLRGWHALKACVIPGAVKIWTEDVNVPAARFPLPQHRWAFPDGTVFADLLTYDGKLFELRTLKKVDGQWQRRVEHQNKDHAPPGYKGAGKACVDCHSRAGASEQYGITVRGSDGVFTWAPFNDNGQWLDYHSE
jgi:hypothetical protein